MDEYKRITDDEVFKTLEAIDNEEENSLKKALKTLLLITLDTRQFLRKMYKNKSKVYKRPTGRKEDIVVGEEK